MEIRRRERPERVHLTQKLDRLEFAAKLEFEHVAD
jgi:hypothetical protein